MSEPGSDPAAGPDAEYPRGRTARDAWILSLRRRKDSLDPFRAYASFVEPEAEAPGRAVDVATIFLTNRECPWRCLMCDLWKSTLDFTVPPGAIVEQVRAALASLPSARWIKLYNAGSLFDPRAVPEDEYPALAALCAPFERVVVECHPALVGERVIRLRDLLRGRLEVAMGLETAHPEVLERLNKGMTLEDFARAADFLRRNDVDLRSFILVRPPFLTEEEGVEWACRSLEIAFACGSRAATLIPTRAGNGALEALARAGRFGPPRLDSVERAQEHGLRARRALVFADLWDAENFARCSVCAGARIGRLRTMNETQETPPPVVCGDCAAPPA